MLSFVSRFARLGLLGVLIIAGCASHGSEFLGKWDNAKNTKDTMEIVRNGEQFLIVDQTQKVGAVYKDGALEVQGLFGRRVSHLHQKDRYDRGFWILRTGRIQTAEIGRHNSR